MRVNQSNTESKEFQIPMVVTDEVIRDFGIKPENVTWRRIGNRKCRVVMVDATEEEYKAYMEPIWAEIKREDIAGHGRILAAKEEGIAEVPCVFADYLTEVQKKAYIIADNRMAREKGQHNENRIGLCESGRSLPPRPDDRTSA